MAEFTRDNLLDFAHECRDYFVAWDNGDDSVMHFIAKSADVDVPFTTDIHDALSFTDEDTACMFANLVNALYKDKECYIVELAYDFTFYLPYDVDTYIKRTRANRSSN